MKILLVTRYFPPLDSIATSRLYSWAKYLSRSGFDVSILTTSKKGQVVKPFVADTSSFRVYEVDYFDPITFSGIDKKDTLKKLTGGKDKQNLKKWFLAKLARIYREKLNERLPGRTDPWIIPAIKELKKQKREDKSYDYILSSYGPPSSHIVGCFAKKIFNARWTADYRDLWLENHIYTGLWPFTWFEKWIEKKIISHADAITSVSKHLMSVLQKKFSHIPVSVIENGFDSEEIEKSQDSYFFNDEKKFRIVYTGSIYSGKQDPAPLFKAVRELIHAEKLDASKFEILFWGTMQGDIDLLEKYGLSSMVRYYKAVSKKDALDIQKSADALLFISWIDPLIKGIPTAKIFEYLAIDKPILGLGITADSYVGRLIEVSGSGIACGNSVETIKHAILQMLNNSLALQKNWEIINKFTRKAEVDRLIKCIEGGVITGVDF